MVSLKVHQKKRLSWLKMFVAFMRRFKFLIFGPTIALHLFKILGEVYSLFNLFIIVNSLVVVSRAIYHHLML